MDQVSEKNTYYIKVALKDEKHTKYLARKRTKKV
jgi:hypothetical protein